MTPKLDSLTGCRWSGSPTWSGTAAWPRGTRTGRSPSFDGSRPPSGRHAQLGEFDKAFSILDEVVSGHGARVHQVIQHPVFDPLRSDPRFDQLLRKIGVE